MNIVTNEIWIRSDPSAVYRACSEVERWPEIFDTVLAISSQELPDDEVLFEMTVQNALGRNIVRSRRRFDRAAKRIDFVLLASPRPITRMDGWWIVRPDSGGARLTIVHRFTVDPTEVAPVEDVERRVYDNTQHILARLRAWVEKPAARELQAAGVL
jgi:hypothetical protein